MERRTFIRKCGTVTAAASIATLQSLSDTRGIPVASRDVLKPPRLKEGDTLGLVAPAGYISEDDLGQAVGKLEERGFRVVFGANILRSHGYFAGPDAMRASELEDMFKRPDVHGIICMRGGYGSARILPYLNFDVIRDNPKVLVGLSDITALSYGLYAKTGLVTFHGFVGNSTLNEYTVRNMRRVLIEVCDTTVVENALEENMGVAYRRRTIRSGKASGELIGGNLSIIVSLIGTQYDLDLTGKLLFIEEIREEPYRIDRMLTQLIQAGKLDNVSGILLGVFRDCEPRLIEPAFQQSFSLQDVLYDRLYPLGIPVIYGMSFGHIVNKMTLPIGIRAELDTVYERITLLEPAVR